MTWHKYALTEIERSKKRFTFLEKEMIKRISYKIGMNKPVSKDEEEFLLQIHSRATEPSRIKWL